MITASPEAMRNRGRSRGPNGWVGASERANSPLAPKHNQTIDGVAVVTDKDDSNAPPKEGVVPRKGSLLDQVFGSIARKGSTSSHMGTRKGSAADSLASDTLASDPQNCTLGPSPYIVPQKVGRDSAKRVHNNHAGTTQRAPEDSPPASQPSSSVQPATNNTLKPPATPGLTKSSDGLLYKTPSPRHGSTLKVGTDGLSRLTPGTPRTRHTDGIPRRTPATRGATPATSGTTSTRTPFKNVVQKEDKELKSSDKVGGLRIYLDPPDRDPVGDVTASPSELPKGLMNPARKGSAEYEIPARWIHLALRMLEHPIGLDVLVEGAFHYVQHKKEAGQFDKLIYDREEDQLQNTAREFLEKVRDNFFNVFITKGLDYESRAETERMSWPKILKDNLKYTLRKDNRGIRLEDYDPKYGAVIYINDLVLSAPPPFPTRGPSSRFLLMRRLILAQTIEAMLHQSEAIQKAKEEKNMKAEENARQCYDITTWYGVITMVHEIYHCWFGFLTGDDAVFTPRLMNFPFPALSYEETQTVRTDTVNRGESGHWCEGRLFAGRPLMLEDPGNPLNSYQSGIPKLWQETGLFFDVCPNFIKNVINGGKSSG